MIFRKISLAFVISLFFAAPFSQAAKNPYQKKRVVKTNIKDFITHILNFYVNHSVDISLHDNATHRCPKCVIFEKLWGKESSLVKTACIEIIMKGDSVKIYELLSEISKKKNLFFKNFVILLQQCSKFIEKRIENYKSPSSLFFAFQFEQEDNFSKLITNATKIKNVLNSFLNG